jgi:hypothetical protein
MYFKIINKLTPLLFTQYLILYYPPDSLRTNLPILVKPLKGSVKYFHPSVTGLLTAGTAPLRLFALHTPTKFKTLYYLP